MTGSSAGNYRKAWLSLSAFTAENPTVETLPCERFLNSWIVFMYSRGLTLKTALHYFDIVAALYTAAVKDGKADPTTKFRDVKARIKSVEKQLWRRPIDDKTFNRFTSFTKSAFKQGTESGMFTDILIFALLNRSMLLREILMMKRDAMDDLEGESLEIARRYAEPRRRYIFPLKQSQLTAAQLGNYVKTKFTTLFLKRNIIMTGSVDDTISSYWAYGALKSGLSPAMVTSFLRCSPPGLPALGLLESDSPVPLTDQERKDIQNSVSGVFLSEPVSWYAMRLRPKVKFNELTTRLDAIKKRVDRPRLFYPIEEIARKVKKKVIYDKVPVLPGIVFFRSRLIDIQPLFAEIGDIAWCYKSAGKYAFIPDIEMEKFRIAIGTVNDETEIVPAGTIRITKDDNIEIIGGILSGFCGTVKRLKARTAPDSSGRTIYRLLLPSDNGIEWEVKVDPRMIKKQNKNTVHHV